MHAFQAKHVVTTMDKGKNDYIRGSLKVVVVDGKLRSNGLSRYGHVISDVLRLVKF